MDLLALSVSSVPAAAAAAAGKAIGTWVARRRVGFGESSTPYAALVGTQRGNQYRRDGVTEWPVSFGMMAET